jgi:hypothetical protein
VVLENSWYIIPEERIWGLESIGLYPNSEKAKYEPYREAWHLLHATDPNPDRINIQAYAEEFPSAWMQ